jgi:hypothetical protein
VERTRMEDWQKEIDAVFRNLKDQGTIIHSEAKEQD